MLTIVEEAHDGVPGFGMEGEFVFEQGRCRAVGASVRFWADVARQDAAALREWFAPEAEVYWHCTDERFTAEEYIRANCEYPGTGRARWSVRNGRRTVVFRSQRCGRRTGAPVFMRCLFPFRGGRITRLDEYWADDGPRPSGGRKSTSAVPSGEAEPSGR